MPIRKPRYATCFLAPLPSPQLRRGRAARCRRRAPVTCAATKLLVVELPKLLHDESANLTPFSERVEVDRRSSQDTTYVVYTSHRNYTQCMEGIRARSLVEPDALAALDGSELYQRQYRTPDPYWAKMVQRDWDAKPAAWVVQKFFGEELVPADDADGPGGDYELAYQAKGKSEHVCERVQNKLKEMGIKARVGERGERVVVAPAAGNAAEVIGFCQMMLRIPEESTFIFGGEKLVRSCVEGKGSFGICGHEDGDWAKDFDQVFVSQKEGVEAVVEGVLHHAVF